MAHSHKTISLLQLPSISLTLSPSSPSAVTTNHPQLPFTSLPKTHESPPGEDFIWTPLPLNQPRKVTNSLLVLQLTVRGCGPKFDSFSNQDVLTSMYPSSPGSQWGSFSGCLYSQALTVDLRPTNQICQEIKFIIKHPFRIIKFHISSERILLLPCNRSFEVTCCSAQFISQPLKV
jgi:hypothetical protein